jgi:hypothetical protein
MGALKCTNEDDVLIKRDGSALRWILKLSPMALEFVPNRTRSNVGAIILGHSTHRRDKESKITLQDFSLRETTFWFKP